VVGRSTTEPPPGELELFQPGEPSPPVPVVAFPYQRYQNAPTGIADRFCEVASSSRLVTVVVVVDTIVEIWVETEVWVETTVCVETTVVLPGLDALDATAPINIPRMKTAEAIAAFLIVRDDLVGVFACR